MEGYLESVLMLPGDFVSFVRSYVYSIGEDRNFNTNEIP